MTDLESSPLDPAALARFGRLELLARLVVEGVMAGLHKSPFKGFSVEFAEHRQYGPGDEIRHIDWRAFGKTDRYYVKEYPEKISLAETLAQLFNSQQEPVSQVKPDLRIPSEMLIKPDVLTQQYLKVERELKTLQEFNDPTGMYARMPLGWEIQ